jgi:hypothetical protein
VTPIPVVINLPVARELIGFLSVFASALTVALPRQAAVAAAGLADLAERQRDVDVAERGLDAARVLLRAARGQHHGADGGTEQVGGADEIAFRHAGDALDVLRPVARHQRAHAREAVGALADVVFVDQAIAHEDVQQPVGERDVGARNELQVYRRRLRRRGAARIDDDQRAVAVAVALEIAHHRRHGFGDVRADQEDGLGAGDVVERKWQAAIDAEGFHPGGGRRGHVRANLPSR